MGRIGINKHCKQSFILMCFAHLVRQENFIQGLEGGSNEGAQADSAVHKRFAAIQRAADDIARSAPDASSLPRQLPPDGTVIDLQVGVPTVLGACDSVLVR